jgi:hypothetical protein
MNSELGMLLPFAFVIFAIWTGSRILLARMQTRGTVPPDITKRIEELAERLDRLEQTVDASAAEIRRVAEAEQFTTQLLSERSASSLKAASRSGV